MARSLEYASAGEQIRATFRAAESDFASGTIVPVPTEIAAATVQLMKSSTQAYREVLVGCCLARILDQQIDVHLPYASQGDSAYNGRSLDEFVVNPFLQENHVPASRGPFLSVFRRSVAFTPAIKSGLRDKAGFDALLTFIDALGAADAAAAESYLRHLLAGFVALRDAANVVLLHPQRLSIDQYMALLTRLLEMPSGGRVPVLFAVAMFRALKKVFALDWEVEWQGINVSDRASDVGGDITIKSGGTVILAVEVTERPIDRPRVEATFNQKVLLYRLTDYLFLHGAMEPTSEARVQARRYFGQGYELNFLPVREWLLHGLTMIGSRHRPEFTAQSIALLTDRDMPTALKLAWNETVRGLIET